MFAIVSYRQRWGFTVWGWLLSLLLLIAVLTFTLRFLHDFLAPRALVGGNVLVVSGWLPDAALKDAAQLYKQGHYQYIIAAGGPMRKLQFVAYYPTSAEATAEGLRRLGIAPTVMLVADTAAVIRDRTFHDALRVKEVLLAKHVLIEGLDILSEGPHARRTRLLYQQVFPEIAVGIYARSSGEYDPDVWWKSSAGVRHVIDEAIAWLYARFIFSPKEALPYSH